MKKLLRRILSVLLIGLGLAASAQTPTTQGTEFWVSFMRNGYNTTYGSYDHFTLIASAKDACVVTVTNPHTGWTNEFAVHANGVNTCYINRDQGYNDQMGGKAYKGLLVTSTDTISLYIANEAENSYDAANVLPASTLGSQYLIQSYKAMGDQSSHYGDSRASFLVLATEDNTTVQIMPSCLTYDNHPAGQTYTVSLNRGECYHVLNKNAGNQQNIDGDFSGTTVVSVDDKPIAVFNGNSITSVPGGLSTGYDHVFEQAMPTDYWGKQFVVTSTRCPAYMNLQPDQIKVTALNDNTTVTRDGAPLFTLNSGESRVFEMNLVNDPCTYLEADNPIAVFLYQHSHGSGTPAYGDPSMVWISPVEQTVYEVTFSTFEVQEVEVHYVNVVCYTENVAEMTLDGQNISSSFSEVPGLPELSYTRLQLNHAAHTLRCPKGFVAHVYGIGQAEGYAYSVGSSAKTLTKQLYVDDILSSELPDGYTTCQREPVHFRVETNYEFHHVSWNFGDYGTANGPEVTHAYASAGNFNVMSVVYREIEGSVLPFDTLGVVLHVNPVKEHDEEVVTCAENYTFNGIDYPVPGDYDVTLETTVGCDSVVHLHLQLGNGTTFNLETVTTCASTFLFDGEYYDVPGAYDVVYESENGCDSIIHLTLEQGLQEISHLPAVVTCEQYEWYDSVYTQTNHHLEHLIPDASPDGCDSLYILDLTIGYPPENPETSYASCDTYYWHGIPCSVTDDYHKTFTTAEGCVFDSILHFTLIPNGESFDTVTTCDQYPWQGHVYETGGTYHATVIGENGCESYLTLFLTLYQTPPFNEILGLGNVAVSTNYWPGEYVYYLDDTTGMDTSTVTWELSDNANGEWDFRPHGASCTIVTYTMTTKTLTATTGDGECDKTVSKTIHCSGYGVGENESFFLEVYPNPANDELRVKAEDINEVKVFNLLGQPVKKIFPTSSHEVTINVEDLPPALYIVEVDTRKGMRAQLVSISR